ncbi:hypothetical protein MKEN_01037700 [Mycena kentingensis (nom. inval.)]|nr:hypothetical protein MKEN_01037700 [Mycena kentingensis (nom. inval.)]
MRKGQCYPRDHQYVHHGDSNVSIKPEMKEIEIKVEAPLSKHKRNAVGSPPHNKHNKTRLGIDQSVIDISNNEDWIDPSPTPKQKGRKESWDVIEIMDRDGNQKDIPFQRVTGAPADQLDSKPPPTTQGFTTSQGRVRILPVPFLLPVPAAGSGVPRRGGVPPRHVPSPSRPRPSHRLRLALGASHSPLHPVLQPAIAPQTSLTPRPAHGAGQSLFLGRVHQGVPAGVPAGAGAAHGAGELALLAAYVEL